jgi:nucleotide-binding universal stress UspA family protein
MHIGKIILASHGTAGARAAEDVALALCAENGATLLHLLVVPDFWKDIFVVPDFWKGMMGDDWLNNAVTRIRFGDYVENQLAGDAAGEIDRLAKAAALLGVTYSHDIRLGRPADCLAEACAAGAFDLAVIGSPRPKGTPGYRSRMTLASLVRSLNVRLMIIPPPEQ